MLLLATQPRNHWPISWKEKARWIKYEEEVEVGANRFSHPYLTLITHHSILQLRNCLKKGAFLVDASVRDYEQLVEKLVDRWIQMRQLGDEDTAETKMVKQVLTLPKEHLVNDKIKQVQSTKKMDPEASAVSMGNHSEEGEHSTEDPENNKAVSFSLSPPQRSVSTAGASHHKLKGLMRKLAHDCEASVILIGNVKELKQPLAGFVRLEKAKEMYPEIPDIPVPLRFLFVLLVPIGKYTRDIEGIGSTMGVLMVDEVFRQVAYNAIDTGDLCDGVEEFLSQTLILPAGRWNKDFRWEPIDDMPPVTRDVGQIEFSQAGGQDAPEEQEEEVEEVELQGTEGIHRTGRPFGGVVEDIKRKSAWYLSDLTNVCTGGHITQSIAAAIFLFFSNITKIITLGGVMGKLLDNHMAAVENLLSGGICGVSYALFSGQPLAVLSATGPTLVFEAILYNLCQNFGWHYLPFRFWVGFWTALIILVLVALDASTVVALITRFTEEAFATLISIIFVLQAFEELFELRHEAPLTTNPKGVLEEPCVCNLHPGASPAPNASYILHDVTVEECAHLNGTSTGAQCFFNPDVFLFSALLFIGTFCIAMALKFVRHSGFFPHTLRHMVADFGVLTAIVSMTLLNYFIGLNVQTLKVPDSLTTTQEGRGWFVNPASVDAWYIPILAILPALFFTILVVMDQQITSVIVNRKDNKLRKGHGYHLDILIISILMLVCSLLGMPFYVADTVISIMHVDSLRLYSECSAPGEKPQFLGVNEQRVTALLAHLMIGLAVFLTPIIRLIPLPVLLGIFLYMGICALMGQQLVQRFLIFFMPMKHQPDYPWLRKVHLKRVHLFTLIQILSLIALFVVKYIKKISIIFPVMLVVMVIVRKLLDNVFTQKELCALDDPLPKCSDVIKPIKTTQNPPANKDIDHEANEAQSYDKQSNENMEDMTTKD